MFSADKALCTSRAALLALAVIPLLSACAVSEPPQILSSTGGAAGTSDIAFVGGEEESALRTSFRGQLKTAFADSGVRDSDTASVVGDFAIGTIPAEIALAASREGDGSASGSKDIVSRSSARDPKLFDNCDAVRFRASLVLFDRKSGDRIHKAEGESIGCEDDTAPLRALAKALVNNAMVTAR